MKNINNKTIIEDIWYEIKSSDNTDKYMDVMVDTGIKDFSIGEVSISGDEEPDELYDLAYEIAHDLGYILSGEVE